MSEKIDDLHLTVHGPVPGDPDEEDGEYDDFLTAVEDALESIEGAAITLFREKFPELELRRDGQIIKPAGQGSG